MEKTFNNILNKLIIKNFIKSEKHYCSYSTETYCPSGAYK